MNFAFCFSLNCCPYSLSFFPVLAFLLDFLSIPRYTGSRSRDLHLFKTGVISLAILNSSYIKSNLLQMLMKSALHSESLLHFLYSSAFWRPASIMWNRSYILNTGYFNTTCLDRTDRCFSS